MTCREKLKLEHPDMIDAEFKGGCWGCPNDYGYNIDVPDYCPADRELDGEDVPDTEYNNLCARCWDHEIPEDDDDSIEGKFVTATLVNTPNTIKDSGDRTEFSTGAVRDMHEGKGRCDLLPLNIVRKHLESSVLSKIHNFQTTGHVAELYDILRFGNIFPDPFTMYLEVAKHFEDGAKKYGEYNWQKGIPVNCYIDSAVRHYLKHLRGDTDERHDRAFVWNILCCIWTVENKPGMNNLKKDDQF